MQLPDIWSFSSSAHHHDGMGKSDFFRLVESWNWDFFLHTYMHVWKRYLGKNIQTWGTQTLLDYGAYHKGEKCGTKR